MIVSSSIGEQTDTKRIQGDGWSAVVMASSAMLGQCWWKVSSTLVTLTPLRARLRNRFIRVLNKVRETSTKWIDQKHE